ncbi:sugar transporter [Penicillium lagena]|uniref:sugar transporter n=1 Tax=Penicillium lagena TaxID=94218 RepID=UPI002541E1E9|nr:sugar transporter [Penicillium lagena]KAJ5606279.1 sugar transporter [Penicillium lagena]
MASYLGLRGMPLVMAITLACATGFLLFGYDNGVFSGLTTDPIFLETMGNPNASLLGFIVAVYELGCLVGALASAVWGERLGRRMLIVVGSVWLIIGTVIQCTSYGRAQMIVGRIVTGFGMGGITSAVPVWQCECTPAPIRGRTVAMELSALIVGIVIAYWIDYGCSGYTTGFQWRFPIAFQIFFALILVVMCFLLPESPRWLASQGRPEEALDILCLLRDGQPQDENIQFEYTEIKEAIELEAEESGSWKDCFTDGGIMGWQRVAIACSAQALQEFTGTNIITYYAPYVMVHSVGLDSRQSLLLSGGLQLFFLVASFIPWFIIDKVGRRKLFMFGSFGMGACQLIAGLCIMAGGKANGIAAITMLYLFQGFFTWGWMSNMWSYPPEILPLRTRQRGAALSVIWQWLITFLVVEITPVGIQNIGWKLYVVFCILNWATIPIVYFLYPETAGRTLESIDFLFANQSSFRQVVKLSQRKDFDESPVARTRGAQVQEKAVEEHVDA